MHSHFHTQQFTLAAKLKTPSELFIPFSMSKHICHIEKVIAIDLFVIALSHPHGKMLPKKKRPLQTHLQELHLYVHCLRCRPVNQTLLVGLWEGDETGISLCQW